MKFILSGQVPSGKNAMQVTRTGRHYPLKRFTDWRDKAEVQIRAQVGYPNAQETACKAVFAYFPGDLRRRDVPGMIDALFHLFERMEIVKDDALIKDVTWITFQMDRKSPRVIVELVESASPTDGQQSAS